MNVVANTDVPDAAQVDELVEAGEYIQPYIRSEMLQGRYPVPIPAIEALEAAIVAAKEKP